MILYVSLTALKIVQVQSVLIMGLWIDSLEITSVCNLGQHCQDFLFPRVVAHKHILTHQRYCIKLMF